VIAEKLPESPWIPLGDRIVCVDVTPGGDIILPEGAKREAEDFRLEVVEIGDEVKKIKVGDHLEGQPRVTSLPGNRNNKTGEKYIYPELNMLRVAIPFGPVRRFAGHKMDEAIAWRDKELKKRKLWPRKHPKR
jgi:hypothetical protein